MYVINCTKPNIGYSISKLSRFVSNSSIDHWKTMKRLLKYLRYTMNYELHYIGYPAILEWYNDAN